MTTAKELLEQRDELLDDYEAKISLPVSKSPGTTEELETYLSMDKTHLEKLSIEDCGHIAYRLMQFAFYIQRSQNRELARVAWAENEVDHVIANSLNNFKGYGYKEKSIQAIKNNEHASKVNQIAIFAKQRAERLNFVSNGLKNLAEMIRSIQINKRSS